MLVLSMLGIPENPVVGGKGKQLLKLGHGAKYYRILQQEVSKINAGAIIK